MMTRDGETDGEKVIGFLGTVSDESMIWSWVVGVLACGHCDGVGYQGVVSM